MLRFWQVYLIYLFTSLFDEATGFSRLQLKFNTHLIDSNVHIKSLKSREVFANDPVHSDVSIPISNSSLYYWNLNKVAFSLLPLAPGARRKTVVEEIVKDEIWTLDQIQGVVNVNVPVRSTIVKLSKGGLFIYNPVAPTLECLNFVRELEKSFGPVKYIVLGSLGLEHKALAASFCQYFKGADVWIQPGQWSFPINLPNVFLGFPLGQRIFNLPVWNNKTITSEDPNLSPPWLDEFDYEVLGPLKFKSVGGFGETAIFHKRSRTLLITDAVIKVSDEPPPIIAEDPRALIFHSRDAMTDAFQNDRESQLRGWRRMTIFSLFFFPSGIRVENFIESYRNLSKISQEAEMLGRGSIPVSGGLYPWTWVESEEKNFKALQQSMTSGSSRGKGRVGLFVAPILQKLILNRDPEKVLEWADRVSRWPIVRVIPCHFENDIKASARDFRNAFSFLESNVDANADCPRPDEKDFRLLNLISNIFTKLGIVAEEQPLIPARILQRETTFSFLSRESILKPWDIFSRQRR